jgi:hypothetical protein
LKARALALLLAICVPAGAKDYVRLRVAQERGVKERSTHQRRMFLLISGHPNGWPGHIVDHIRALKHGGLDVWWNLQWQTVAEAREKDGAE